MVYFMMKGMISVSGTCPLIEKKKQDRMEKEEINPVVLAVDYTT